MIAATSERGGSVSSSDVTCDVMGGATDVCVSLERTCEVQQAPIVLVSAALAEVARLGGAVHRPGGLEGRHRLVLGVSRLGLRGAL